MKKINIAFLMLIIFSAILVIFTGIVNAEKITIISDANDGHIEKNDAGFGYAWLNAQPNGDWVFNAQNTIRIGQIYLPIPRLYIIDRAVLFFNTTRIDFDNWDIVHARISMFVANDVSTVDFGITVQKHNPYNMPLLVQDYNRSNFTGDYGQFVNTLYFPSTNYWVHCDIDYNNIDNFTNDVLNMTGNYACVGLRSNDDIGINAPSTNEYIDVYATDYGTVQPTLEIWYINKTDYDQTLTQWFNTTTGNTSSNCSITATYWGSNYTLNLTGVHTIYFPNNILNRYWFNVTSSTTHANCSVNVSYNQSTDVLNVTGLNTITTGEPVSMLFEISELVFLSGLICLGFAVFKKDAVLGILNAMLSAILLITGTIEGLIDSELIPIAFLVIVIACAVAVYKGYLYTQTEGDN